jgi:hypothetical protein
MAAILKLTPRAPTSESSSPLTQLDRKKELLDQFGIKNPLEIDDKESVLTIDPGVGATQVDTYATVPKGKKYDGLFVKLTQTEWTSARVEGAGIDSQKTTPPRTMAGAFGYWAARNGSMVLAGKEYKHSELDRATGEVVLSDLGKDKNGNTVLETRRLKPSAGAELNGEMLTALPPKVGLIGFPEGYKPEPALLAAHAAKLAPGATLHVSGQSFEHLKADVTSVVRPSSGGWSDPSGAKVEIETMLRVTNTDRAAIHHEAVVLRSGESGKKSYYDDDDGPATIHTTSLAHAKLNIAPGETQEISVEKQSGQAHVEYRINDDMSSRAAGAGSSQNEEIADRFMVLDSSQGRRHAGAVKFFDGVDELGGASAKSASPGTASTTSDRRSSGVTSRSKITWSAVSGAENAQKKSQTVKKEYELTNISPVAGQLKLTIELEDFSEIKSIKINGKTLTNTMSTAEMSAKLESEKWGGSKVHVTLKMPAGSESAPSKKTLDVEVEGKFTVYN